MAKFAGHLVIARNTNPIPSPYPLPNAKSTCQNFQTRASSRRRNEFSLNKKKSSKTPRRLIKISTSDGRWQENWNCDYIFSFRELRLEDLIEEEQKDAEVLISLYTQKHASFGLSVEGRIMTSLVRKCSNCSTPYCREIDTNFNVWILQSSQDNRAIRLPEIGGDDPSVIYVKPGDEANLDSLVQDTIRLTISVKDTCSDLCANSEPSLEFIGEQNTASIDKRWFRLLELRKRN